ncbi:hypothetical protein ACIPK5_30615 [Streptomyces sp. NPDC086843]|uniref:hypothetical protein n=1 Tax=Streptomyces sp. NPDC086843 TaxID=3365763 RepID=UPI0038129F06
MLAQMLAELNDCRLHGRPAASRGATTPLRQHPPLHGGGAGSRLEGPHRYGLPTAAAYEDSFPLWRALRRDNEYTYLVGLVDLAVQLAPQVRTTPHLRQVHVDPDCTVARDLDGLHGDPVGLPRPSPRCAAVTNYDASLRAAQ